MAYYVNISPPVEGGLVARPFQQDLEFVSLTESESISQMLSERGMELRLEGLVHVFLPKKTPQKAQADLDMIEASLLTSLANCTEDVLNAYNREFDWKTTFAMKEWKRLQLLMDYGTDAVFIHSFSNALFNLPTHQKLPLYIRKQNCTVLFTKTSKSHSSYKIETFRPSLPSEQVMSTVGSFAVTFPHTIDVTENVSLLCSPCFIQQMRDLALNENEAAMPKVKKGGHAFAETRDVADPFLVTELLIGMLGDIEQNLGGERKEHGQIMVTKKVRDTVEWDSCPTPFRRSGLWTSAKVSLQLCLLQEMGETDAKMVYKLILLRLICSLVNFRADTCPSDWDLMHQMLAKLGKRAKKLSEMAGTNEMLLPLKQNILKDAYRTVNTIGTKMNFLWTELSSKEDSNLSYITRSNAEFRSDLNHSVKLLDYYVKAAIQPIREEEHDGVADIIPITRWNTLDKLMKAQLKLEPTVRIRKTDANLDDEVIWLHDVENVDLDSDVGNTSSIDIYNLFFDYADRATKRYSIYHDHDPVSFSRMVITLLRLYKKLDEIALKKYAFYKDYNAGIDPASIFPKLMGAEGPSELEKIDTLEKYFKNRSVNATYNSIIYNSEINANSFSVRCAKDSSEMKALREEILKDTKRAIKNKHKEVEISKERCEETDQMIQALDHNYDVKGEHMKKQCTKCIFTKSLNKHRHSVRLYEKPLPSDINLQHAVCFEILIPPEISCVRDALALITKEILEQKQVEEDLVPITKISTKWLSSYYPIKEYTQNDVRYPELIQIGSTNKPVSVCHYKKTMDVMVKTPEDFIVENGMNCFLFHEKKLKEYNTPPDPASFKLNTSNDDEKLYKSLQFAVSGTDHTQNLVIAEQSVLNNSLPPPEYLAFCCLRSGHRIQIRNLYKFLSDKSLNIEKESVLALILQTIWSAGILEDGSRTTQSELCDGPFAEEFLKLLENIIKANSHNWSSPLTMLTPVAIIIQILKFNEKETVRETCVTLLRKCRDIVDGWVKTVQDQLSELPAPDPDQKQSEQLFLKTRILEMLICSAFTYHGDGTKEEDIHSPKGYILQTSVDLRAYLKMLSGLHYYVNVEKIHDKLTPFLQILLKVARHRIPLNLESFIHERIKFLGASSSSSPLLTEFVHSNSSLVKKCDWTVCRSPDKKHVYQGRIQYNDGKVHKIHVDIIGGAFLIDGYPPTHLPTSISQDPLFQRYFGPQYGENFKVQRDATTFTTTSKISGKHYSFFQAMYNGKLLCICRELVAGGEEDEDDAGEAGDNYLELLDSELFRGVIASPFVENYTHWLNPRTKEVYFRKRIISNPNLFGSKKDIQPQQLVPSVLEPDYKMIKNSKKSGWKLLHQSAGKHVMSALSEGYGILSDILSRVEEWRYINILVNSENTSGSKDGCKEAVVVSANLPRLGLNFNLVDGHLHSVEYPGYYISLNQSKGTLVGLKNALLLEKDTKAEINGKKQMVMVPHGTIVNERENNFHHVTSIINNEILRQPPFFVYEMDQVLNRLKADKNKSAWLYLAALHGSTSSCLPDLFTGLTGTEMAVWVLQSGLVWSCAPYDFECKKTLQMIQNLSPVREYYPANKRRMEHIVWLPRFPSYAAYDGYEILVQKLIQDSERLEELFIQQRKTILDTELHLIDDNKPLRYRAYIRHQCMYNPCAHLSKKYIPSAYFEEGAELASSPQHKKKKEKRSLTARRMDTLSLLKEIAAVRSNSAKNPTYCWYPPIADLNLYLITTKPVHGTVEKTSLEAIHGNIKSWMNLDLRADWLGLYNLAISADQQNLQHQLTMILCTMAYHQKAGREQLLNIHFISRFNDQNSFPSPYQLNSDIAYVPSNHNFRLELIQQILRASAIKFPYDIPPTTGSDWKELQRLYNLRLAEHQQYVEHEIEQLSQGIVQVTQTQNPGLHAVALQQYFLNYINMAPSRLRPLEALAQIQYLVGEWSRNLLFKNFVQRVHQGLTMLYDVLKRTENYGHARTDFEPVYVEMQKVTDIPLDVNLATYFNPSKISCKNVTTSIYTSGQLKMEGDMDNLDQRLTLVCTKNAMFEDLKQSLLSYELANCLNTCGLFPRLVSVHLLGKLVCKEEKGIPSEILDHIGGMAVLQTHIKRLNRCIKYELEGVQMATELERELENKGHEDWSPKEYPEWLLLELDLDLMIRPIQVQVARQMITMPDGGNGVMQLNMGEGKTSLIVPMLVSSLASEDTLCRVTVLNSIFKTNWDLLSNAIGGLLGRRVYVVPCRRDAKVKDCLSRIWEVYKECIENHGAVLTLAEYRLSPRLMAYEKLLAKNDDLVSFGLDLLELENWLREHCRDILDESDELLSAKYQLIYTTGAQLSLGGGTMRWTTCQSVLSLVPAVLRKLWIMFGDRVVEFDRENFEKYPEQFTPCRLLTDQVQFQFYQLLADEILGGRADLVDVIISEEDYQTTKRFLTEPEISKEVHEAVLQIFKDDTERLERILLLSGYLRRGILQLALCKRWRVEYGVDGKGRRQMAVPFRAKDVAAERTEFGHPDVGIVLTHLSYYYSGLKEDQLMESFMVLKSAPGPEAIYNEWIMDIPKERLHESVRSYEGINLRDFKQRTVHLFPVLRKNKRVIDFWLSHKVFPKESKQFPRKIVTTAWDLCYERNKQPTTGFSGTNDCSILLPLPIQQQDLLQLQETNRQMEEILKLPENSKTVSLQMGISCREILQKLKKDGARVLIDAGALMLELGNEQVAHLWLETDSSIEGVVYFNEKNELLVKVRASNFASSTAGGRRKNRRGPKFTAADIPLEVSPFRERLDKCGIFLDDQHTRGTDLKFPNGFKGCVTVGSRMKRDKLIQAAMRMRKLGAGHSVSFYLSHEVSNKVHELEMTGYKLGKDGIITKDILKWVTNNSEEFEKEGLIHWAMAGKNYAQKLAAEDMFHHTTEQFPSLSHGRRLKFASVLGNHCMDEEVVDLMDMYGSHLKHENLVELLEKWFGLRKQKLEDDKPFYLGVQKVYNSVCTAVLKRCNEHIPDKTYLANNFEEEQEKELELEPEHEEIRCVKRQKNLKACEPRLHQDVRDFVLSGKVLPSNKGQSTWSLAPLSEIFASTTFSNLVQPDCWKCDIYASADFTKVVTRFNNRDKLDVYLRPISYIVSLVRKSKGKMTTHLLLISPHEANELIGNFKKGEVYSTVKLHMFSPRCFLGQDILLNNPNLQLPSSSSPKLIDDGLIAPLLLASGSLFFGSMAEQRAYVRFLGFIPRPWPSPAENEALRQGWILKTGFLLPKFAMQYKKLVQEHWETLVEDDKENADDSETESKREALEMSMVTSDLNFEEDPSSMVKAILENRHVAVRDSAHVLQLLNKCYFVEMGGEEEGMEEMVKKLFSQFRRALTMND